MDRASRRIVFMASTEGGVEIEKVAVETPEKILQVEIDPLVGAQAFQGRDPSISLGLSGVQIKQFVAIFLGLAKLFADKDLALIEINPLVITDEGNLHCLDAKSLWIPTHCIASPNWRRCMIVSGGRTRGARRAVGTELCGAGWQHWLHG